VRPHSFLLLVQKKRTKEKDTRRLAPCYRKGFPALLALSGARELGAQRRSSRGGPFLLTTFLCGMAKKSSAGALSPALSKTISRQRKSKPFTRGRSLHKTPGLGQFVTMTLR
jgi:hypothetical protein